MNYDHLTAAVKYIPWNAAHARANFFSDLKQHADDGFIDAGTGGWAECLARFSSGAWYEFIAGDPEIDL